MIRKTNLFFIILAIVTLFVSFYRLADFYHLDFDQERDYQVISDLVYHHKLTLIGPRAVSSAGFFLGPWYYYLLTPFFIIFNGQPLYAAFVTGLINLITTLVLFYFLKKHTNQLTALSISLLWLSVLNRTAWNVMFIPLFTIGILFFLLRPKQTTVSLLSLVFLTSLGIHFHFQVVLFIPLIFFYSFFIKPKFPPLKSKLIIFLFIAFLLPLLPLIVFDLRHNFLNLNAFYHFFADKLQGSTNFSYLILLRFSLRDLIREIGQFTPWSLTLDYLTLPFVYLSILVYFFKTKQQSFFILSLFPTISLLTLSLYSPPNWPEYYHLSATLVFLICLGLSLSFSKNSAKLFFVISLVTLILTVKNLLTSSTDPFSYVHKQNLITYVLNQTKPKKPQINPDFPFGEGLGFSPIREYYQRSFDSEYDLSSNFLMAYPHNPGHNKTIKIFGAFAVSVFPPK